MQTNLKSSPLIQPSPSISDSVVCDKIDRLFKSRRLAEQCEQLAPYGGTVLPTDLKELQLSIYCLDKYFEHTWNVSESHLKLLWSHILLNLGRVIGKRQNLEELVRDIRAYQRLEESIRTSSDLSLPSLAEYYHLKTCDVRLARNILVGSVSTSFPKRREYLWAWELFDLASEVCDDLNDISEDLGTFNGNRFLLELSTAGPQPTIDSFHEFELILSRRLESLREMVNLHDLASVILDWASEQLIDLRNLLSIHVGDVVDIANCYTESLLAKYRNDSVAFAGRCGLRWLQGQSLRKDVSLRLSL